MRTTADRGRTGFRILAIAALMCVLAGCNANAMPYPDAPTLTSKQIITMGNDLEAQGNVTQAAALRDGVVTELEYTDAFGALSRCLMVLGYPAPRSWTSPIDGRSILFEAPAEDADPGAGAGTAACAAAHWNTVSAVYQDLARPEMDESLRLSAIACMRSRGYSMDGKEDTPARMSGPDPMVEGVPSEQADATIGCLTDAQHELFPEIPTVSVVLP